MGVDATAAHALRLSKLLRDDDVDGAIEAGLMDFAPPDALGAAGSLAIACSEILATQRRLRNAWAARERHRARNARLARRADERGARRAAAPAAAATPASSLPPAAAAALARAKARAAGK